MQGFASTQDAASQAIVAWSPRGVTRAECFLVPITLCYELTARLRSAWKGIEGGPESRAVLDELFARLRRGVVS